METSLCQLRRDLEAPRLGPLGTRAPVPGASRRPEPPGEAGEEAAGAAQPPPATAARVFSLARRRGQTEPHTKAAGDLKTQSLRWSRGILEPLFPGFSVPKRLETEVPRPRRALRSRFF